MANSLCVGLQYPALLIWPKFVGAKYTIIKTSLISLRMTMLSSLGSCGHDDPSGRWHGFAERAAYQDLLPCLAETRPQRVLAEGRSDHAGVKTSFVTNARTYGARQIWRDVLDVLEARFWCGLHKIERLMRAQALRARPLRRALPRYDGERSDSAIAPNVLDRQFTAEQPNRKWIADFTYIWTAEGWLYVAAVIDLLSCRVVGWSMKAEMSAQLVTDALLMAIWRRGRPDALLHHSDRQRINASFRAARLSTGSFLSLSRWLKFIK
jgi:transposase InsO family protein